MSITRRLVYIGKRLVYSIITLLGLSILLFLIMRSLPGGPARAILGITATPEHIEALDKLYGFDQPLVGQYLAYVGRILQGDLGQSYFYHRPVTSVISDALPITLQLAVYVVVLCGIFTVGLATLAVLHRGGLIDHIVRALPTIGIGMPSFWVGAMLLFLFAMVIPVFPAGGLRPGFLGMLQSLFLPALTLSFGATAVLVRSLRLSMIDVVDSDYVMQARAKGMSGWRLGFRHILPNATIPTLTLLALVFIALLGGALIIETVFGIPGMGNLLITAFRMHDMWLVLGVALLIGALILAANLIVDVLYTFIDPRVALK